MLGTNGLNSAHHLHLRGSDVVLIPTPSNDINDPLRWPTWKKYCAFMNTCLFAFMVTGYVGGFAPALYQLGREFETPLKDTANLILWPLLVGGLGVSIISLNVICFGSQCFRTSSGFQRLNTWGNVPCLSFPP